MFKLMKETVDAIAPQQNAFLNQANSTEEHQCPVCREFTVGIQLSDEICTSCKSNLGSMIDYKPEWRNEVTGDDMSRCNLAKNPMLPESSYCTTISYGFRPNKALFELQRSLIWTSIPYHERSMKTKMDEIATVCRLKDIPLAIIEYTQALYFNIITALETHDLKRKRGKNDAGLRAAALFIAFHDDGKPRTYKEIASIFGIEPKYVSDGIKLFSELIKSTRKVTSYNDFITEFCSNLNITEEIKVRISVVADKADAMGLLENHAPPSIVAGCIYYVGIEYALPIKLSDIEEMCGVSGPTITKICDKLFKRTAELF